MKFNVLVVAAMVIISVNAGGHKRLPSCLGGRCMLKAGSRKGLLGHEEGALQESDPNETGPTCDDLEVKLRGLYDNISVRNSRVWLDMPELYKIMKGNMGRMVENIKNGVKPEVAQKSDGNEARESIYKRVQEWFRLHFEYKLKIRKIRQEITDLLEQHLEAWEGFLATDCLATKDGRFSPKNMSEDLPLIRWHYKTTQAQDTNESGADISNKQDDNDQEKMQESNPRVESYKYLGVLIDSKLDHSAWLKQKRSALEHTISALHPVLANHQLTVNYRSRIFSAVVMGKAYYGLELVGGNKSHLAPLQTTINKGIRLFTGARLSTAIGPLLVETGIGSLLTRSLVSRVRLLERSVTKRTPINAICSGTDNDVFTLNVQGQLVRSQRWFWSRRTKQLYRNRYWLTPQVRPKTVKQRHSFALMETLRTCGDSASLQNFDQSRAHGTRYLMLARMDALWTARKAIQIGILVDTHPFSVDHCILCDQQLLSTSIAHLVVECEQVTGHRIQSGLVPAIQKSRLRLLGRALDPGVENVYTWLRGGVLNGEADLDQRWLDGTVEHESMGTRHDNRALAARLADFLQVAYRQYQSTLWKYHRDRLVEVG
ncbi:hypothetical protein BASA60_008174 [Batrachochytrium salamandrivorans]|nr:hypothetical protein BASA60_008174 [Batrachochytrium salamandrivorans]